MEKAELVKAIREGKISPGEAVEKYETLATHIKDIPVDNLKIDVLDCGFPTLNDYMVFKKNRGELIILGARPGMGKSAFLFQVAAHVAKSAPVLIYSLEMDKEAIKARMMAAQTGLGLQRIFKGEVKRSIMDEANKQLSQLHYFIDDRSGLDVASLVSTTLDFHRRNPIGLIIIDYLQLIKAGKRGTRSEEVGDVSLELKQLAKKLNCPVLAASQLSRKCIDRGHGKDENGMKDFRPEDSDLRESGNIEQDADGILFISRHEKLVPGQRLGEADIGISKQRNGPTGWFVYKWLGSSTRFLDPQEENSAW